MGYCIITIWLLLSFDSNFFFFFFDLWIIKKKKFNANSSSIFITSHCRQSHHAMHVFNKTIEEYVFRVKPANMCMYNFRFLRFPAFDTSTITIHQEETCIRIHGLKVWRTIINTYYILSMNIVQNIYLQDNYVIVENLKLLFIPHF